MKKNIISLFTITALLIIAIFSLTGCVNAEPNTRETAKELKFGEKSGVSLDTGGYYWYFFALDTETKIALKGAKKDASFEIFSDDESEAFTKIYSEFWSSTLSSGKYYVKIYCSNGNLFSSLRIDITLFNFQEFPDLPIGSEFSLDEQKFFGSTKEAYYKLNLDKDSNINLQTYKHPDLQVEIIFYYSTANQTNSNIVFDYSEDFDNFEQSVQISSGECIVLVQYERIAANPKKSNIPVIAKLMIAITAQNNGDYGMVAG